MGEFEKERSIASYWGQYLNLITWIPINIGKDALVLRGQLRHQLWAHLVSPKKTRREFQLHPKGLLPLGTSYKWKYKSLNRSITHSFTHHWARRRDTVTTGHRPSPRRNRLEQPGKLCPQAKASLPPVFYVGFTFFNGWKIPNKNNMLWCENYTKFQFLCP